MNYPKFAEVDGKQYKINTDFRIAIECNEIALDETIGDYERTLAIIYKLFGEEALNDITNHAKLIELAQKYLSCGKKVENNNEKQDMDLVQDYDLIETSFFSDYGLDLENLEMHWWKFMKLLNGLSNSELGNCCILNNIRNLRNFDVSTIKDDKKRQEIIKAQKQWALHKNKKQLSEKQKQAIDKFNQLAGL